MADGVIVRTNIADFRQQMRDLGQRLSKRVAVRAASKGTAVIRNAARQNAKSIAKTGTIARAVYMGRSRYIKGREVVAYFVSVRKGVKQRSVGKRGVNRDAFYWRWVEGGHRVVPRGRGLSGGGSAARSVRRQRFDSGGGKRVAPLPFLARAFQAASGAALRTVEAELDAGFKRESAK